MKRHQHTCSTHLAISYGFALMVSPFKSCAFRLHDAKARMLTSRISCALAAAHYTIRKLSILKKIKLWWIKQVTYWLTDTERALTRTQNKWNHLYGRTTVPHYSQYYRRFQTVSFGLPSLHVSRLLVCIEKHLYKTLRSLPSGIGNRRGISSGTCHSGGVMRSFYTFPTSRQCKHPLRSARRQHQ